MELMVSLGAEEEVEAACMMTLAQGQVIMLEEMEEMVEQGSF